jgi:hypothetical protein
MTAKEKLHKRVEALSEEEAQRVLAGLEDMHPGDVIDDWGNLSAFTRALSADTFRRLDEAERAEFGETIGETWERESRK